MTDNQNTLPKQQKETEDYAPESPDLNIIEGKQNKGQNPNKER